MLNWGNFITRRDDSFAILQMKSHLTGKIFMGYKYLQEQNNLPKFEDYCVEYIDHLNEEEDLEDIYERFNINRPEDFHGHSLSISDVVVIKEGSNIDAYYVDVIGFTRLYDFIPEKDKDVYTIQFSAEELCDVFLALHYAEGVYLKEKEEKVNEITKRIMDTIKDKTDENPTEKEQRYLDGHNAAINSLDNVLNRMENIVYEKE